MQPEDAKRHEERCIAAFLRENPGWLAAHPELYAVLDPPLRVHGERLTDHMAAMLEQARRHGSFAAAGRRAADGFALRVQGAVVALMRATDASWCLQHDLPGLLHVDSVRLCAEPPFEGATPVPAGTVAATLGQRDSLMRQAVRSPLLHGEAAPLAAQEALVRVPLRHAPALLALGCRDGAGLDGAGTQTLAFLGQAVAAALERG